jgi:hypothetical protein
MKQTTIKQTYKRLSDGDLDIKAMGVWKALENNAYFPALASLPQLEAAIDTYHDRLKAAGNGGRAETAEKNKAKAAVIEILRQLSLQVGMIANGNRTMLLTSGFDLTGMINGQAKVDAPDTLQVSNGVNPGEMIVKVKKDKSVRGYNHQYSTDPLLESNTWTTEPSTRSRHVFKGLQQGKKYWFRSIAIGTNGQTAYSKQVSCVVL